MATNSRRALAYFLTNTQARKMRALPARPKGRQLAADCLAQIRQCHQAAVQRGDPIPSKFSRWPHRLIVWLDTKFV